MPDMTGLMFIKKIQTQKILCKNIVSFSYLEDITYDIYNHNCFEMWPTQQWQGKYDSFDIIERHKKTNIFIAVLGIDVNVIDNIIEKNNENINYSRNSSRAAYMCDSLSICKLLY